MAANSPKGQRGSLQPSGGGIRRPGMAAQQKKQQSAAPRSGSAPQRTAAAVGRTSAGATPTGSRASGTVPSGGASSGSTAAKNTTARKSGIASSRSSAAIHNRAALTNSARNAAARDGKDGKGGKGTRRRIEEGHNSRFSTANRKRRRRVAVGVVIAALLVGVVVLFGYASYTYMLDKINNPISADSIILDNTTTLKFRVEKSESTESISERLFDLGLIKNKTVYRILSKFNGYDGEYNAGTYTLSKGLSYEEIMVILSGQPETVKVTFPEGFTTTQIAERLEANNVCTAEEFLHAVQTVDVSSYLFLQGTDLSTRDYRLDGYLFPDTYEFDVLAKPEDVIYKMLNNFNTVFKPAYYETLQELGVSLDEVVTLASIVEREAKLDSERATIAGVFYNRYNSTDPTMNYFQSCATLRYVFKKLYNVDLVNITAEDEKVEDPYNTYLNPGFTPGPICSPGRASLEAALFPQSHEYFYFLAKTDDSGGHIFNETYAGHLAAQQSQR